MAESTNALAFLGELISILATYTTKKPPRLKELERELYGSTDLQRLVLSEVLKIQKGDLDSEGEFWYDYQMLLMNLLERKLPLSEDELLEVIDYFIQADLTVGPVVTATELFLSDRAMSSTLRSSMESIRKQISKGYYGHSEHLRLRHRLDELLGTLPKIASRVDHDEPWTMRLISDTEQMPEPKRNVFCQLIEHLSIVSKAKPSSKWLQQAVASAARIETDQLQKYLTNWILTFTSPRSDVPHFSASLWDVAEPNADLMKGLIWIASQCANDDLIRAIAAAGLSGQKKIPGIGPRSTKVTNATIWSLSQIDNPLAIGQLAIMRSKITNKSVQKQIDKAINAVAQRLEVPPEEVEEMAVPTYGLAEVGLRVEALGDFTAELHVTGTTSTEIRWIKPDGKQQKSVPKAVKDNYADELKELKAAAKDIQKILPAQRDRVDLMQLKTKSWPLELWKERYLHHPLVGTLARRLIWSFQTKKQETPIAATCLEGQLVDSEGTPIKVNDAEVSLWHPIGHDHETIIAWRRFFEEREIKQPFKQAHREIYLLTDAERNTGSYSNRYASHVIKQHQYNALCALRGWTNKLRLCVDDEYPPTFINLPEWELRAEFWVEGLGEEYGADTNETGVYHYLATDQVRFYSIDAAQLSAHAAGGGYGWGQWRGGDEPEPLSLEEVPPLVLSEILRDVDLFVGVASVGNDPTWQDGGPEGRHRDYWQDYAFGDLSATAKTRREILERLVPRLKIADRCTFDDKFLVVRGDRRSYKIHLGSSNILMEPNDQYLCIVPSRGAGPGDKVFLPFEGDQRLAVILSKAIMLADDTKIKDPTILNQIGTA
ncbi:DUF4132 domain-containing protein [Adhaeretor mobilis]|uniref:Uncharacterized protein n=1 Tax=Adhaeretor mobilis TaxID=1930276 RepID=A0A517MQC6_9BACT|nr:DUF4132 domain-containing protein [Adhaeretor mobilis]QDS97086.1 hypothetical protein HG15A2_03460 [Adhaeretor mobilis]